MSQNNNTDICLNIVQATVLANEINLAKNLATTSVNLTNANTNNLTKIRTDLNNINLSVNTLSSKLEKLCDLLSQANLSNVDSDSLKYKNL